MRGFYFITDEGLSLNGVMKDVEDAIRGGARMVQYRRKAGRTRELYTEGLKIGALCREAGVEFIVNDRLDIALAVEADGLHIGRGDLPLDTARSLFHGRIGMSVNTLAEGVESKEKGADYLGVGPIFATSTKLDASPPVGVDLLTELRSEVALPLVAIGGIKLDDVEPLIRAGADAVCAISATAGSDVEEKVRAFAKAFGTEEK